MTKALRKAIMRRSALQNKYYSDKLPESERVFKKQRNYTNKLLKKEKKKYFANLDVKNYMDNKKFWKTVKPLFSNYNGGSQKITLVENDEVISNDKTLATIFNEFFVDSVKSLNLSENNSILNPTAHLTDPVEIALKKFESHPSILDIKEKVAVKKSFPSR